MFVDQFIASFAQPPLSLTFDLDAVDDPTHGSQQLTLFHGFYEQYQYLPLVITWPRTTSRDAQSAHGTAAASLGADDDLEYLVTRLRAAWPNVRIRVRGDGGFGNPTMYEVSERLEITYTYGLRPTPYSSGPARNCWPKRCGSGTRRTNRNGCSRGSGIGPVPGRCPAWWW